jgi:hypothetical protein
MTSHRVVLTRVNTTSDTANDGIIVSIKQRRPLPGQTSPHVERKKKKMSRKNVRVVIPRNADELIELSESIVAKHNEDPVNSPLAGLDMAAFEALVTAAVAKSAEVKQLRMDAETATEDRDTLLGHRKDQNTNTPGTIVNFVVRCRDTLFGIYKGQEQHLGDFGFEVNQSSASSGGGTGGTPTPPAQTGTVSGTVKDQFTLNPIAGATVEVVNTGIMGSSDGSGNFSLAQVPTGGHILRASASGYDMREIPVNVTTGGTGFVEVLLNPMA